MCNKHDVSQNDHTPLLILHNRAGTKGCYLKNTLYPPYKKPRLPFAGKSALIHHLLRPLKFAHACQVLFAVEIPGIDPRKYRAVRALYTVELEDIDADYYDLWKIWSGSGFLHPLTISGFYLLDWSHAAYVFSLDCSPFNFPGKHGYPDDIDPCVFKLPGLAADVYNECVQELFENDLLLFPAFFSDVLSDLYPAYSLPESTPLFEI